MMRLFRKKEVRRPTLLGWLVVAAALALLWRPACVGLYRFLSPATPAGGGVLVVEGWVPDEVAARAVPAVRDGAYRKVYTTGGPIETGRWLSGYGDWATASRARLIADGVDPALVTAVPSPFPRKDRTYASALALARRLREDGGIPDRIDLFTTAPHARRSRLLFRHALGPGCRVGLCVADPRMFNATNWWRSSEGVRVVLSEVFAYAYARGTVFFLRPSVEDARVPPGESP